MQPGGLEESRRQGREAATGGLHASVGVQQLRADHAHAGVRVGGIRAGERAGPKEPVLTIAGDYALFAQLETDFLGVLARRTRVATNTTAVVEAAA